MNTIKLPWREKISYGFADMGFNFYWTNVNTFIMIFYTDVFGLSAASAATLMFTIKIITAFVDPIMGVISDRTNTRFGKFRPYLIWIPIPLACAAVMTYSTPDLGGSGKLIWAYSTYLIMMTLYTCINIPYNALSGVISNDPQERSTINGLRFICGFWGGVLVTAATPSLVHYLGSGNDRLGWQLTTVLWGIAASCIFLWSFLNTKERIKPAIQKQGNIQQDLRDLTQNRPWVVLFCLAMNIMITLTLRSTMTIYYLKYYVGNEALLKYFLPAYLVASAVGAALSPVMTRYIDKRNLIIMLMLATTVFSLAMYFVPKDGIAWMFALQIALGLALGPKSPLTFSMYADVADYNEWRTGRRATSLTFAAATFSQKLGAALASVVVGMVMTALGYVANAEQSSESQGGILLLMSIIPAVFSLLAAGVMIFYDLDNQKLVQIQAELVERKRISA